MSGFALCQRRSKSRPVARVGVELDAPRLRRRRWSGFCRRRGRGFQEGLAISESQQADLEPGECQGFCVRGFREPLNLPAISVVRPESGSPNWITKWPIAAVHSIPRRQRRPAFFIAR